MLAQLADGELHCRIFIRDYMLDIKFIRENADLVKAGAKKKRLDVDVDKLLAVDTRRKELIAAVEAARTRQNQASQEIPSAAPERKEALLADMKVLKEEMGGHERELEPIEKEWQFLMVSVPNVPDPSVPEGDSDSDNQEVRAWGEKPAFDFEPKSHIEIMESLGMADFERGVKVAGFRGYFLKNDTNYDYASFSQVTPPRLPVFPAPHSLL